MNKIRIYDIENNRIYGSDSIRLTVSLSEGVVKKLIIIEENKEPVIANCSKFVIFQSTGVFDIEGKEIWEGDIVEAIIEDKKLELKVFYHEGSFVAGNSLFSFFLFPMYVASAKMKTINNIYEIQSNIRER